MVKSVKSLPRFKSKSNKSMISKKKKYFQEIQIPKNQQPEEHKRTTYYFCINHTENWEKKTFAHKHAIKGIIKSNLKTLISA